MFNCNSVLETQLNILVKFHQTELDADAESLQSIDVCKCFYYSCYFDFKVKVDMANMNNVFSRFCVLRVASCAAEASTVSVINSLRRSSNIDTASLHCYMDFLVSVMWPELICSASACCLRTSFDRHAASASEFTNDCCTYKWATCISAAHATHTSSCINTAARSRL